MDAAQNVARVACARQLGMLARAKVVLCSVALFAAFISLPSPASAQDGDEQADADSAASSERTFAPTMGVVRAPLIAGLKPHRPRPLTRPQQSGRSKRGKAKASLTIDFTDDRLALRRAIPYRTAGGEDIMVQISARYSADSKADRLLVRYLESLLHGDEIDGLNLMVLKGDEIELKCGVGTAACYLPANDTIVVVGEDRYGGLPTDYVLAHEYGHRIAHYSFNPPFRGGAFWHGPKRWATVERVCSQLRQGRLSIAPHAYWNFPGENFAEAYARYHQRGQVRWQYAPSLKPDWRAFQAIQRDVTYPWLSPVTLDSRHRLGPRQQRTIRLDTPLDGRFTADLYSLRGRFQFELWQGGRRLARAPRPTRDFRLSRLICGSRSLTLKIRAGAAGGAYRLVVDRP